jgi:hypothetical protein
MRTSDMIAFLAKQTYESKCQASKCDIEYACPYTNDSTPRRVQLCLSNKECPSDTQCCRFDVEFDFVCLTKLAYVNNCMQ